MFRASLILLGLLATLGTPPADAQTATTTTTAATTTTGPQRDAQAVTLANQAYQALAGTTQLQDARLEATATWVAGSDEETGSATLEAKGSQESRMALNLSGGERQEIRNFSAVAAASSPPGAAGVGATVPPGAWAGPDGAWHAEALHNSWTDASWFFPAFTLQAALHDPAISLVYGGADGLDGGTALRLTLYRVGPGNRRALFHSFSA